MDFKEYVIDKLVEYTGLERAAAETAIEVPPEEKLGDLAFPCFPLAKVLRKAPPLIAKDIAEKFEQDEVIDRCEAVGGYVNFFFSRKKFISETVSAVLKAGADWGKSDMGNGKNGTCGIFIAEYCKTVPYRASVLNSRRKFACKNI